MYISRRTSQILAVGILAFFFLSTSVYVSLVSQTQQVALLDEEEYKAQLEKEKQQSLTDSENPTFAMKDFHRSETKDGKMLWEIRGTEAEFAPNSKAVLIKDCKLHYISKDDTPVILTSKQAKLYLLGTVITRAEFIGDVKMIHDKETTVTTQNAEYLREENRLIAPDDVKIVGKLYTITGKRLEGDLETRSFQILKDVKSHLKPKSSNAT